MKLIKIVATPNVTKSDQLRNYQLSWLVSGAITCNESLFKTYHNLRPPSDFENPFKPLRFGLKVNDVRGKAFPEYGKPNQSYIVIGLEKGSVIEL